MMMMVTKIMSMVMILPGSDLMFAPTLLAPVPVLVEYKALPGGFERCVRGGRTIWHQDDKKRTIWHQTIWHQDNENRQFGTKKSKGQFGTKIIKRTFGTNIVKTDNLAPAQFGTNIMKRTIWQRNLFGIVFTKVVTKKC